MKEPEVSLYIAMNYIETDSTCSDVTVSIDGAHIKTCNTVHFDLIDFMREHGYQKRNANDDRWQDEYQKEGFPHRIIVCSKTGIGDVAITLRDGKKLHIESKKFKNGNSGEYPAMREAIGQLMTGCSDDNNTIPIVAVPYNDKSAALSKKWAQNARIQIAGIRFMLVHHDGVIEII